jgi:hypothetical protein
MSPSALWQDSWSCGLEFLACLTISYQWNKSGDVNADWRWMLCYDGEDNWGEKCVVDASKIRAAEAADCLATPARSLVVQPLIIKRSWSPTPARSRGSCKDWHGCLKQKSVLSGFQPVEAAQQR